jgi:cytochrome b
MRRLIWPWAIRLVHWLLAIGVIVSFATHDVDGAWHEWPGYVALGAALLRLAWGLLPPTSAAPARYSRFADFLRGPRQTWQFAAQTIRRREPRHLGHNPLAGWLVLALLMVTLLAGVSGWMLGTDRFFGVAWVMNLHDISGHAIVPLVLLHWIAIAYNSVRHRENLVAAMWHGHKWVKSPKKQHRSSVTE